MYCEQMKLVEVWVSREECYSAVWPSNSVDMLVSPCLTDA